MRKHLGRWRASVGFLVFTVCLTAVGTGQALASKSAPRATKGTFTIIEAEDSTGRNSFTAALHYPPMETACKEINQAGGVLGHKCVVYAVDTAGDAADAGPRVASAIAKVSNPLAIEGINSTEAPALVPLITGLHVLAMSIAGEQEFFHYPSPRYLYMLEPPDSETGFGIAFGAAKSGSKHPAVIMTDTPDTAPILSGALVGLKALKVTPSIILNLAPDQSSYATEAARVLATHPDSLMVELDPQTAGSFFQSVATELGKNFTLPIFTDSNGTVGPWQTAVANAIGASTLASLEIVTSPAASSTASQGYRIVANNFYKYPGTKGFPLGMNFNGPFYDGVILSALAALDAHSFNPAVYSKYIYTIATNSPGATEVQTFAQGKAALAKGKKIYYFGASGNFGWTKSHAIIQPVILYHWVVATGLPGPTLLTISVKQIDHYLGL